jgi:sugar phosphate isomerase/epimerase
MGEQRLPFALTAYSLPHVMGYLPTKDGAPNPVPLGATGLMDAAVDLGLAGVEMPLVSRFQSFDGKYVEVAEQTDFVAELRDRGLKVIADYGVLIDHPKEHFIEYLHSVARTDAKVVRTTLSTVLCGDRRVLSDGWDGRMEALAARLREVLPVAEDLGLAIAVENHQDATTNDLLRLYEISGSSVAYGITLDSGNPLAVGEEPVEAARRLAHLIRHIHVKDYTMHYAPEGYRLVRCAAGIGVVDFPAILEIVRSNGHDVLPGIEVAAQATRTIPFLDPGWWDCYPPMPASGLAAALNVLWSKGIPADMPYSTAWERGEDSAAVVAEEWDVLRRSVQYFRKLELDTDV